MHENFFDSENRRRTRSISCPISRNDSDFEFKEKKEEKTDKSGICEQNLMIKGHLFKLFDILKPRKKFSHYFENVTAICFVVSLIDFDEKISEDEV